MVPFNVRPSMTSAEPPSSTPSSVTPSSVPPAVIWVLPSVPARSSLPLVVITP